MVGGVVVINASRLSNSSIFFPRIEAPRRHPDVAAEAQSLWWTTAQINEDIIFDDMEV